MIRARWSSVFAAAALLSVGCVSAWSQQMDPVTVLLDKAAEQSATLTGSLPSFTCARDGVSEVVRADSGKVKEHVTFTGSVRAVRSEGVMPGGGPGLEESIAYATFNGRPWHGHKDLPYEVHQSFTSALNYVSAPWQACYDFSMARDAPAGSSRLNFVADDPYTPSCENLPGTTGYVVFNAAGKITHIERTIPTLLAVEADLVPYAAVDFAPVTLDGKTYWLVSRLVSERQDGKDVRHLDANYSACRLFHANVTLLPGTTTLAPGDDGAGPQ